MIMTMRRCCYCCTIIVAVATLASAGSCRDGKAVAFQQQQQQQQHPIKLLGRNWDRRKRREGGAISTTKTPLSIIGSKTIGTTTALRASNDQGSAGTPYNKKKVAVLGCGGYTGSLIFGFLQRCQALYNTGLGRPRCIGATADTAVRLNRSLSKHFVLAQADESYVSLTNLQDVQYVTKQLNGYDAVVFPIDDLYFQSRTVTGNTYEKSPNEKTMEMYWGSPKGSFYKNPDEIEKEALLRQQVLSNFIMGSKLTNTIQHAVIVGSRTDAEITDLMKETKIPYTFLQTHPDTYLKSTPNYTFKSGIQSDVTIVDVRTVDEQKHDVSSSLSPIYIEDLAAICVQVLQTLDWSKSRHLIVSSSSSGKDDPESSTNCGQLLRHDQEWCVNSLRLQQNLSSIR